MRSIARVADVSLNTVAKLLVDAGTACQIHHDATVRGVASQRVQCDEIWSFYYAKDRNVPERKRGNAGSVWTWTALDADTKLMLTWVVGGRSAEYAMELMDDLRGRLVNRVQLTTDGHGAYLEAVEGAFGGDVDYAQLVKLYGEAVDRSPERKYSPAVCVGARKVPIEGKPDRRHVSTSYVERANLSMRMGMRRFTRLTNAHSKKFENHCHALALYFTYYNFVRINQAVRMSPAMAAGVSDRLWEMTDIVRLVDEMAPAPKPRGKYKKRAKKAMRDHALSN